MHSAKLAQNSLPVKPSDGQSDLVVNVGESTSSTNVPSHAMDMDVSAPFALVDEIADASLATEGSIQLGDQIVKFGNGENGDNLLRKLASEAQTNLGCAVPVMVLRQGAQFNLMVTSRTWQGRGLLGCHFQSL
ncbi:putative PDZ domain-containing protein [Rosa chinensis]|uniref:Putative PDZ domain-containing protein n=1 Tax=Rosa chinensis TaxID=74649 RepID=A0A2P6QA45_ROSCH|nr:putative PDZ domain-containing protein [Rosa chinensis]